MLRRIIFAASIAALAAPVAAETIEGVAIAIDGDTLDMTGTRIRLVGIDAPENEQTCIKADITWNCGADASASLSSLANDEAVVCQIIATDVYGRKVARCRTRIFDLGQEQLRRGMAVISEGAPSE